MVMCNNFKIIKNQVQSFNEHLVRIRRLQMSPFRFKRHFRRVNDRFYGIVKQLVQFRLHIRF